MSEKIKKKIKRGKTYHSHAAVSNQKKPLSIVVPESNMERQLLMATHISGSISLLKCMPNKPDLQYQDSKPALVQDEGYVQIHERHFS